MRGKLQKNEYGDDILGITPADAGKTVYPAVSARYRWDHPRGCGENCKKTSTATIYSGSPPRMRGKLYIPQYRHGTGGITPADAGKTITPFAVAKRAEDHPRGCGENREELVRQPLKYGSPPRMRGKLQRALSANGYDGITPADAGKT